MANQTGRPAPQLTAVNLGRARICARLLRGVNAGARPVSIKKLTESEIRQLEQLDAEEARTFPDAATWWKPPAVDTLTEAYWRDPDPDWQGMLSSDRILAYHYAVGRMIRPFNLAHLKPASYELTLGPRCLVEGQEVILGQENRVLRIEPNSIVYVSMREQLLLPHWLVGRFNLAIDLIYDGLLLGTGPQVDPGFQGALSCPLHNISSQPIELEACEPFAKIDFVKTSFGRGYSLPDFESDAALREAAEASANHALAGYEGRPLKVWSASKNFRTPIFFARNVKQVKSSVRRLDERTGRAETLVRRFSVGGGIAAAVLVVTLFAAMVGAFLYTLSYTDGRVGEVDKLKKEIVTVVSKDSGRIQSLEVQRQALCRFLSVRSRAASGC